MEVRDLVETLAGKIERELENASRRYNFSFVEVRDLGSPPDKGLPLTRLAIIVDVYPRG